MCKNWRDVSQSNIQAFSHANCWATCLCWQAFGLEVCSLVFVHNFLIIYQHICFHTDERGPNFLKSSTWIGCQFVGHVSFLAVFSEHVYEFYCYPTFIYISTYFYEASVERWWTILLHSFQMFPSHMNRISFLQLYLEEASVYIFAS